MSLLGRTSSKAQVRLQDAETDFKTGVKTRRGQRTQIALEISSERGWKPGTVRRGARQREDESDMPSKRGREGKSLCVYVRLCTCVYAYRKKEEKKEILLRIVKAKIERPRRERKQETAISRS